MDTTIDKVLKLASNGSLFDKILENQFTYLGFNYNDVHFKKNLHLIENFLEFIKTGETIELELIHSKQSPHIEIEKSFYYSALSLKLSKQFKIQECLTLIKKCQSIDEDLIIKYKLSVFIFHSIQGKLNTLKVLKSNNQLSVNDLYNLLDYVNNLDFKSKKIFNTYKDLMFLEVLNFSLSVPNFIESFDFKKEKYKGILLSPFFELFNDKEREKKAITYFLPDLKFHWESV